MKNHHHQWFTNFANVMCAFRNKVNDSAVFAMVRVSEVRWFTKLLPHPNANLGELFIERELSHARQLGYTSVVDIIMKCILLYAVWIVYVLLFSNPPFRVRSLFLFVIQNEEVLPTLFHVPLTYHALRHSCIWVVSDSHDSKFTIKRFTAPHQLFRGCCWVSYGQQCSIDWVVVSMTGSTMFHQPAKLDVHKPKNQLSFFEPPCSAFFC